MVRRWKDEDPGWRDQWFDTVDGVCLLSKEP